jgi:DNA-binding NtrC family response regulator
MPKPAKPQAASSGDAAASSSRWILMVDDEPALLRLAEAVLTAHGWRVETAADANAAMKAIASASTPPALLICDVLMPGVDGLELTRRLLARLPGMKAILISGHLTEMSWWPTDLREQRFLTKPFSNEQLVNAVSESLEMPGAGD